MERDALEAARDDVITPFLNLMVKSQSQESDLLVEKGSYEDVNMT